MIVLGKTICILPDGNPDKTGSGIIIPKTISELPPTGKVLYVGPQVEEVRVGDRVNFARKSGSAVYENDQELLLITEDKVLFVYDREEQSK